METHWVELFAITLWPWDSCKTSTTRARNTIAAKIFMICHWCLEVIGGLEARYEHDIAPCFRHVPDATQAMFLSALHALRELRALNGADASAPDIASRFRISRYGRKWDQKQQTCDESSITHKGPRDVNRRIIWLTSQGLISVRALWMRAHGYT
jgi:hypothetical protein